MSKDRSTGVRMFDAHVLCLPDGFPFVNMQAGSRVPGNSQPPVKIYNAVYSSVQVCVTLQSDAVSWLILSPHDTGI